MNMKQPLNDKVITCLSHYIYTHVCTYFGLGMQIFVTPTPHPPTQKKYQTNKQNQKNKN